MLVDKQNELRSDLLFTCPPSWRRWLNVKTTYIRTALFIGSNSLSGSTYCTVHVFDMPHRNRIALEHRERIIRAFDDDNEDYLLVADTLGVNRSTARGIDLFTDTAAILNLFWDLRSIMGCPGGTRSVFTRAFWAKRELHMISREKGDHYYFQTWHTIFFFPITIFYRKT